MNSTKRKFLKTFGYTVGGAALISSFSSCNTNAKKEQPINKKEGNTENEALKKYSGNTSTGTMRN